MGQFTGADVDNEAESILSTPKRNRLFERRSLRAYTGYAKSGARTYYPFAVQAERSFNRQGVDGARATAPTTAQHIAGNRP